MNTFEATPVRVLRIIARLNIGGPARHAAILDEGLRRRGYATLLVHGSPGSDEASFADLLRDHAIPNVHVPELGRRVSVTADFTAWRRLLAIIREMQPDIVHTHTAKAGALGRVAARVYNVGRPRARRCGVVHTYHGHVLNGYFNPAGNAAVRTAERTLARFADRLIAISETQRRELADVYRVGTADQFRVVPLGLELAGLFALDPSLRRPWPAAPCTGPVFTYVGRLVPIKDLTTLVDAFALVQREVPSATLLVVGDGPLRPAIEQRAGSHGIARSVVLAGWQRDLAAVYGSSDVVVLSSRNEGTPVALIEAMAAGRPVVATAVGGVPDVVNSGHSGLLVPSGRPELLGAAMLRLARDPDARLRLGQAGRDSVRARFDSERLVNDIDQVYREVLSSIRGS